MYSTVGHRWRRIMELSSMGCTYIYGWAWVTWLAFGRNVSIFLRPVDEDGERVTWAALLAPPTASGDVAASGSAGTTRIVEEEPREEDQDQLDPSTLLYQDSTA
ncbi:hypothetical protein IG631_08800 [Alternaria alternata]|nr:hypothetical protein IG631_08800 [Alternaria alternata]